MKTDTESGGILLPRSCNGQTWGAGAAPCRDLHQFLRYHPLSGTVFGLVVILSQLCFNFELNPCVIKRSYRISRS